MNLTKTRYKNLYFHISLKTKTTVYYALKTTNKIKKYHKLTETNLYKANDEKNELLKKNQEQSQEQPPKQQTLTFNEVFHEYIHINTPLQTQKEIDNKLSRYKNHISPTISKLNLQDIKYKDCQQIINNALNKNLKPKTAKNIKAVMQAVFNYAIKNEYTTRNPAQLVDIPSFDNKVDLTLSEAEIKRLINEILSYENKTYRLIFLFALHGRRLNEILKLQRYQIKLEEKEYFIPAQKNKAKKHQSHKMLDLLYNLLSIHIIDNNINQEDDYIFQNKQTKTHLKTITKQFKKLKQKANITKYFRFHDFRHIIGTLSTINNIPIEKTSHALGHSDIAVTSKIYVTRNPQTSREVIESLFNNLNIDTSIIKN